MTVTHRLGSYEIEFVSASDLSGRLPADAILITDENIAGLYPHVIAPYASYVMPAGESEKNLSRFGEIVEWLAARPTPRNATLVALGGGVIGDLVGYVAASYMRGVRYIQVPTTLLAQVDSSVGGKVGVDLPQGKNLVGAFYPPNAVYVSTALLKTLDDRQFVNGMAEVWKYGFIMDADLVTQLSQERLHRDHLQLDAVVEKCIAHKRHVVENDEFERNGLRATLNFGHTIGHAIEQVTRYERYLHGEAIAIGMVLEARLSEQIGLCPSGTARQVEDLLREAGLPVNSEVVKDGATLIDVMRRDKKASSGKLAFSLLTEIGRCKLIEDVPQGDVEAVLTNA